MKRIIVIFIIAITIKFIYFLFAWISGYGSELDVFRRNDSFWYEKVAVSGHSKITPDQLGSCKENELKQSYYAFFPLYPVIVGGTMKLCGISFNKAAFFYSIVFSLLLFFVFFKFIYAISQSEKIAFNSTLILMLFPFHYYFSVYYTEALFLLLLVCAFFSIEQKKMVQFSFLSSLLVLVRPNGLFMLIPLFIFFIEGKQRLDFSQLTRLIFKQFRSMTFFAVPVIVFVLYCTYLKMMTGDFFAYKTAQAGWCRETVFPWVPILRSSTWMDYFNSAYLLCFFVVGIFYFKKIPLSFSALIWISLLLPLTANSITSPRFISAVFVFSFIFGKIIHKNYPIVNALLFILFFLAQMVSFQFWLAGSSFSY